MENLKVSSVNLRPPNLSQVSQPKLIIFHIALIDMERSSKGKLRPLITKLDLEISINIRHVAKTTETLKNKH